MQNAMQAVKSGYENTKSGQSFKSTVEQTVQKRISILSSNGPVAKPQQKPSM